MKAALIFLFIGVLSPPVSSTASEELSALIDDYWTWRLRNAPEFATSIGNTSYNDRVESYSLAAIEDVYNNVTQYLQKLTTVDKAQLTPEEKVSYVILKGALQTVVDGYKWRKYGLLNPVNFLEGFWTDPKSFAFLGKFESAKDFEDLSARMIGWASEFENMEARMRQSIMEHTTSHRVSVGKVPEQIANIVVPDPRQFLLYGPFNETLDNIMSIDESEKARLRSDAVASITVLMTSLRNLSAFIQNDYLSNTRQEFGVISFANGTEYYRACLRWHLSVDLTPEEIHQKGLEEVARISGKMRAIMDRLGHGNLTMAEFFTMLKHDSRFKLGSAEEILDRYRYIIKDLIGPKLPEYFRDIPDMPVTVEAMPYDGPGGLYLAGSPDGSRPGVFQANVERPNETSTFSMVDLALHEADPGHHLQDIYSKTSKTLPNFRKQIDYTKYFSIPFNFPFYTAYTEGWGLYSEALGEELGIYADDYELMGRYGAEIFRACRLVVDTGLHHYNWTHDQAVEYMLNYTDKSRNSLITEVNRYITWPGQACAYKIGEIKIRDLREKAKSELGDRFDIRDFHFVILNNGGVPLDILEELVDDWIESKKDANKRLAVLMQNYFDWRTETNPDFATVAEVNKYNDRLESLNHTHFPEQVERARQFLMSLMSIPRSELTSDNVISRDVLENVLQTFINGSEWADYGASNPFNFLEGLNYDPSLFYSGLPFNTLGDFFNYIRRLELLPLQYDEMVELSKLAIQKGTTNNNVSMTRVPGHFDSFIADNENVTNSQLYFPFMSLPDTIPDEYKSYLETRVTAAIAILNSKLRDVRRFIVGEYMPRTRSSLGVGGLPRGQENYQACLKWHTSLDLTPQEVHDKGLREVERITGNMEKTIKRLGYHNYTIRQFYEQMQSNTSFLIQDGEETLDRFREIIFHRIQPVLPKYFKNIPGLPLVVRNSASDGISGEYMTGSADGSIPGTFFANVRRPKDNPTYAMVSLSLHEALPGHHLADSYSLKSDLPNFRKYYDWKSYNVPFFFPFFNSYVEGWALYAEYLGEEMGIYQNDYELMGRYSDEMWRACRLVIDTGIHTMNWDRERAIQYMMDRVSITRETAEIEIDRYTTWPGQACGYKLGELKLKELRKKATAELGDKFDVRDFHYVVLSNGAMPLDVLENLIDDWIALTKSGHETSPPEKICPTVTSGSKSVYSFGISTLIVPLAFLFLTMN